MAGESYQDKTEKATPRRRKEAVEKGDVAKSTDFNSAIVLLVTLFIFKFFADNFSITLNEFVKHIYHEIAQIHITPESLRDHINLWARVMVLLLAPLLLTVLGAGVASSYLQVGFIFSPKALKPNFKKISPLSGIKRLFSARSLIELLKGSLKIVIVTLIAYSVISKYQDEYWLLASDTVRNIIQFMISLFFELGMKISFTLLILAIADYAYQKWEYEKKLRMTKQEVKEEVLQQEGNPLVKGKIKALQRELGSKRSMAEVPEATVVVTNPTHIAIALKYEPASNTDAPQVVAKGQRKLAEKIKEIARAHNVPIIENKPLAKSLYDTCEVGSEIPVEFYQAVAEILSQVYQANNEGYEAVRDRLNE